MNDAGVEKSREAKVAEKPSRPRRAPARGSAIEMGLMPDLVGYHLRCAHVAVFQHFNATLGVHDISAPQFGTLLLIEANPGVSQSSVAEALRFDRSTLVQIIDRLEGRDLVTREASAQDRRSHALYLTEAGKALLEQLKALSWEHEQAIAANLTDEERATLIDLLERLHTPGPGRPPSPERE
jgi:DNA-binding MarR family transcriptional regulator